MTREEEIRARLEAANPSGRGWSAWPWGVDGPDGRRLLTVPPDPMPGGLPSESHLRRCEKVTAFVAHAPADIRYLLEKVDLTWAERFADLTRDELCEVREELMKAFERIETERSEG